jgi:hypothetical protein
MLNFILTDRYGNPAAVKGRRRGAAPAAPRVTLLNGPHTADHESRVENA